MPNPTVDAVAEANIALDGSVTVVDTYTLVLGASKVAVVGQNDPSENGIYDVPAMGAWVRDTTNWPASAYVYPSEFSVKFGSPANARSEWFFDMDTEPVLDTDPVDIVRRSWPRAIGAGTGLVYDAAASTLDLAGRGIPPGTYERISLNEQGVATAAYVSTSGATQIEGLNLVYVSANSLMVEEGVAWVPGAASGAGALVTLEGDETLVGMSLTANTWYYIYLYEEGGEGALEYSTQKPDARYLGGARVKGGPDNVDPTVTPDETRRYLGAIRATSSANVMYRFVHRNDWIHYIGDPEAGTGAGGIRLVAGLSGTTYAARDASPLVPPTSTLAEVYFNTNASSGVHLNLIPDNVGNNNLTAAKANTATSMKARLDAAQQFYTKNVSGSGSTDLAILAYLMER